MDNFEIKIAGVFLVIFICFITLITIDSTELDSVRKANESLKKENYELKQKLEKVEKEKLNCVLGFNKGE